MKKILSILLSFILMLSLVSGISTNAEPAKNITFIDASTFKVRESDEGEYYYTYYKILDGVVYEYNMYTGAALVKAILPENSNTKVEIPDYIECDGKKYKVAYISLWRAGMQIKWTLSSDGKNINSNVSEIVIPDTVKSVDGIANCSSLKKVTIGKNVEEISYCFYNCKNLRVVIDKENKSFATTNNELYDIRNGNKKLISVFNTPENYVVKSDVTHFVNPFIENNKFLETITVTGDLKLLEASSFSGLKKIKFTKGAKCIDKLILNNNVSLKTLNLKAIKVKKIEATGNSNLKSVKLPNGVKKVKFYGCEKLKSVNLPKSIKKITMGSFGKTGLKSFSIPKSVKAVHPHAFSGSENLRKVTFPQSVKAIRINTFQNCNKLCKIVLNHKTKAPKIHYGAFTENKEGICFYVKNNKVADDLLKKLQRPVGIKNAKIYVGKTLVYKDINSAVIVY